MMPQATTEKSSYWAVRQQAEQVESFGGQAPSWLNRLRGSAIERFEELGFPTTGEEDWRYTNVSPIAKGKFAPASESTQNGIDASVVERFTYAEARQSHLVFIDGIFRRDFSSVESLPAGVIATDLRDALTTADRPKLFCANVWRVASATTMMLSLL